MCYYELWIYPSCTTTAPPSSEDSPSNTTKDRHHRTYYLIKRCDAEHQCLLPSTDTPSSSNLTQSTLAGALSPEPSTPDITTIRSDRPCPGCEALHTGVDDWSPKGVFTHSGWKKDAVARRNVEGLRGTRNDGGMFEKEDRGRSWDGWNTFR